MPQVGLSTFVDLTVAQRTARVRLATNPEVPQTPLPPAVELAILDARRGRIIIGRPENPRHRPTPHLRRGSRF